MFERPWEVFFRDRLTRMLSEKARLLDIGGGLRLDFDRSNRQESGRAWILDRIKERNISYVVLDYVDTYHPDIVGDIQDLPLPNNSEEAIVCSAVLEHVENPIKAAAELYRVTAPGGYCLVYVPFIYYYHAEKGYYGDYWRFTDDGLRFIFKSFDQIELQNVRGPLETLTRLTPLGKYSWFQHCMFILDSLFGKLSSKQTSGYLVFLKKS